MMTHRDNGRPQGENMRVFPGKDGETTVRVYSAPVNYYDAQKGAFRPVDNTLVEREENGRRYYTNRYNDFKVRLYRDADIAVVEKDAYAAELDFLPESAGLFGLRHGCVRRRADGADKRDGDSVVYESDGQATDMAYSVADKSLKEDIIVRRPAARYTYRYRLRLTNLVAEEDGGAVRLLAADKADRPTVFVIPAPFMTDADGNRSDAVRYALSGTGGAYTLDVIADPAWINAPGRAFPVTIDPTVQYFIAPPSVDPVLMKLFVDTDYFPNNFVSRTEQTVPVGVMTTASNRHQHLLLKLDLPDLSEYEITGAVLGLYVDSKAELRPSGVPAYGYDLYSLSDTPLLVSGNTPSAVDYSDTFPVTGSGMNGILREEKAAHVSFADISEKQYLTFDITDALNAGYTNYLLQADAQPQTGMICGIEIRYYPGHNIPVSFYSISYRKKTAKKSGKSYTFTEHGMGRGTVDVLDRNVLYHFDDIAANSGRLPIAVSHIYNDRFIDSNAFEVGQGWRLNIHQRLTKRTGDPFNKIAYVYTDAEGYEHEFTERMYTQKTISRNGRTKTVKKTVYYYDEDHRDEVSTEWVCGGYTLVPGSTAGSGVITDRDGNKLEFSAGKLYKMTSGANENDYLLLDYFDRAGIIYVRNGSGQTATLKFEGAKLSYIDYEGDRVTYTYDGSYLSSVTHGRETITFTYDNDWSSSVRTKKLLTVTYAGGEWVRIERMSDSNGTFQVNFYDKYDTLAYGLVYENAFGYNLYNITHRERTEACHFDEKGTLLAVEDLAEGNRQVTYVTNTETLDGSLEGDNVTEQIGVTEYGDDAGYWYDRDFDSTGEKLVQEIDGSEFSYGKYAFTAYVIKEHFGQFYRYDYTLKARLVRTDGSYTDSGTQYVPENWADSQKNGYNTLVFDVDTENLAKVRIYITFDTLAPVKLTRMHLKKCEVSRATVYEEDRIESSDGIAEQEADITAWNNGSMYTTVSRAGDSRTAEVKKSGNRVTEQTDYDGIRTVYEYDDAGNATGVTVSKGGLAMHTAYGYESGGKGRQTSMTDERGKTTAITSFSDSDAPAAVNYPYGTGKTQTTEYTYDALYPFNMTKLRALVADAAGTTTANENTITCDASGNVTSLRHAGTLYTFEYDGRGRMTTFSVGGSEYARFGYRENPAGEGVYGAYLRVTAGYRCLEQHRKYLGPDTFIGPHLRAGGYGYRSDGGYAAYYDGAGRLLCVKYLAHGDENSDFRNAETIEACTYDDTGRLTERETEGGYKESYVYRHSAAGETTTLTVTKNGVTVYSVTETADETGRVTGRQYTTAGTAGKAYDYTYEKALDSRPAGMQLPDGESVTYGYDALGRITSRAGTETETYTYLANGSYTTPYVSTYTAGGETTAYAYDDAGNIRSITRGGTTAAAYEYDGAGRLLREESGSRIVLYKYDGSGNLLQKRAYPRTEENKGKSTAALNAAPSAEEKTYTYMTTGSRDRLRSYNGSGELRYDTYGNAETWFKHGESSRIGLELSRDRHGRLTKITDAETGAAYTYEYDGNGLRESKTAQGITHTYRYIGEKLAEEIRSDGKKLRYYYDDAGLRTIGYESGGVERVYRVRRNVQGDVEKLVDASGTVVVEYVYDAWGNHTVHDTSGEGLGTLNSIRYRGYCYDTETGLYYLQSRYYDPEVGRFLSADSIEYLDPETINGLNLYAYCGNNPVNNIDPTGNWTMPNWLKWLIGGVVIVGLGIATIATGGAAAGVAGFIVAGAFKGAVIGAVSGALVSGTIGGITSAIAGNGFWNGFVNGAADGFMSGAIIGGITGAISSSIQVANAAKYWDKGTYRSAFRSMQDHYQRKIVQQGLNKGYNIVKYTQDAVGFANHNARILSLVPNYKGLQHAWTLNTKYFGYGWNGLFTATGKIITFGIW